MQKKPASTLVSPEQVVVDPQLYKRLDGFANIVAERFGYVFGRKLEQKHMNDQTKLDVEPVKKLRKEIREGYEAYFEAEPTETKTLTELKGKIGKAEKDFKPLVAKLKKARAPFAEKISHLGKAVKFIDNVVIPDTLKLIGKPVAPLTKPSDWVEKALKEQEAEKA